MVMKKPCCMPTEKTLIMRRINSALVTGPTGAIGVALCNLLVQKGIRVYAVVRPNSPRLKHLREIGGLEIVECDVSQLDRLPAFIPNADALFHLAWMSTTGQGRNNMDAQLQNIRYTLDAVLVASVLSCKVFIGAGSQAEYGRVEHALTPETPCFPENGYGMAKLCAGQMSRVECEKYGIDHVWPRILSVYGPYDGANAMIPTVIKTLLANGKPALTKGEQIWDFLYSDDAAEALYKLAMLGRNGCVYPLGSGRARPLKEYIEKLRDSIDASLPLGFGEVAYGEKQVMHLEADVSALRRDVGFVPSVDFGCGIRKTIDYLRKAVDS